MSKQISALQLGQRVTFTRPLHRVVISKITERDEAGPVYADLKVWSENPHPNITDEKTLRFIGVDLDKVREGIIVGKRSLANGERLYLGADEGLAFAPKERFTAYMVAFDLHRKPALVRPEHIEVLEDLVASRDEPILLPGVES